MKIDNAAKPVPGSPGATTARAAGTRATAKTGAAAGASSAAGSTTVETTAFHAAAGAEATFDAQKVAEIRQAISEGRFRINSEKIADGLISSVRDMLDSNRRTTAR